jgi:hypothetical protein
MTDRGLADSGTPLFAKIASSGMRYVKASQAKQNALLDAFCDYFEMSMDSEGRRHYVRQHQLRRAFAMMFFWGNSFGGLDTLRWFLGHTDAEHLYHYITESTTGEVLAAVKAAYVVDSISTGHYDPEAVVALLKQRYQADDFSLLDADELTQYVEDLILEGRMTVEPDFIEDADGRSFRILIVINNET